MFQTELQRKSRNTFCQLFFFSKFVPFIRKCEKFCRAEQATNDKIAHAHLMLDSRGYKYTLRMCNTYWFCTAGVVTRICLNVSFIRTLAVFFTTNIFRKVFVPHKYSANYGPVARRNACRCWRKVVVNISRCNVEFVLLNADVSNLVKICLALLQLARTFTRGADSGRTGRLYSMPFMFSFALETHLEVEHCPGQKTKPVNASLTVQISIRVVPIWVPFELPITVTFLLIFVFPL